MTDGQAPRFGVCMFITDETASPAEVAVLAEAHAFDGLYVPEHTHVPAGGGSPYPGGGVTPRPYGRTLDPFVALTAAVCATRHLTVGFGVCLLAQRDPVLTAKAVASLDLLAPGRVEFGVGAGWNLHEMRNHGVDPTIRYELVREQLEIVESLWSSPLTTYDGQHLRYREISVRPQPAQRVRTLVGGSGASAQRIAIDLADAWMPLDSGETPLLLESIDRFRERANQVGRTDLDVVIYGARADASAVVELLRAGASGVIFWLPSGDRAAVEQRLNHLVRLRDTILEEL